MSKVFTKLLVVFLFLMGISEISFGASFPSEFGPREPVPGLEGVNHVASYITPDGQRMLTTVWVTDYGPCYMRETTWDPVGNTWTTPYDLGFPNWAGYHTLSPDQSGMYYGAGPASGVPTGFYFDTDGNPENDAFISLLDPTLIENPFSFGGDKAYLGLFDSTAPGCDGAGMDIAFCIYDASDPVNGFGVIAPVAEINTWEYIERHPYVTPDHQVLLFVSNRAGGYGGLDIWKAVWNDSLNRWDNVQNLGPNINTASDEKLPFYCPGTQTLYFTWARGFADNLLMQSRPESISSTIDIDPDTLNLSSKEKWVTCYIELPEGFDVSLIDGGIVELEGIPAYIGKQGWAKAEANEWNIVDHDEDGIPERMVKFDAFLVQLLLTTGDVPLTVYGGLIDGTIFEGTDTIKVIDKGGQ